MSDTTNPETPTATAQEPKEPENPTSADVTPAQAKAEADAARAAGDELAAIKAEARKWESQAKANAEAAKKLAEIEEASKTEAEKAAERLAASEAKVKEYETREQVAAWKDEIAKSAEGIPDDKRAQFRAALNSVAGSTEEEITANAEVIKSLFVAEPQEPARPGSVPTIGKQPAGAPNIPLSEQIAHAEAERDEATPGSEPWKTANQRVMDLKGEQLYAASQVAK